ncbi:MAG TPA: hypothetical protein PKI24_17825, partial [Nitrospira sp.]|nr:hypothetical protein [Nitrospira sp.]HNP41465.1 hypothetical protein [Nitrospira sp.]
KFSATPIYLFYRRLQTVPRNCSTPPPASLRAILAAPRWMPSYIVIIAIMTKRSNKAFYKTR